jgi:hypothetical protein
MMIATDIAFAIRDHALLFKGIAHVSLREYGPAAQAFDAALAYHHAAGAVYYQSTAVGAVAGLLARIGSPSTAIQLLGALQRLRDRGEIIGAPRDLVMQQELGTWAARSGASRLPKRCARASLWPMQSASGEGG